MDNKECVKCRNNQDLLGPFEGYLINTNKNYEQKGIMNIERTYNVDGIIRNDFYVCEICLKNHLYSSGIGCLLWGILFLIGALFLLNFYFEIKNDIIGLVCSILLFILFFISIIIFIKSIVNRSINLRKKFVYNKEKMEDVIYIIAALSKRIRHPNDIKKLMNGEKIS